MTFADEARRWEKRAKTKARELMDNEIGSPLNDDQIKAVDEIVEEASAKAKEQGAM